MAPPGLPRTSQDERRPPAPRFGWNLCEDVAAAQVQSAEAAASSGSLVPCTRSHESAGLMVVGRDGSDCWRSPVPRGDNTG